MDQEGSVIDCQTKRQVVSGARPSSANNEAQVGESALG